MNLREYQEKAIETDKIQWRIEGGPDIALLGILGELGSVAGVIKKKHRDADAYSAFQTDLIEELGDLLWYISVTSHRLGLELKMIHEFEADTDTSILLYRTENDINKLINHKKILNYLITGKNEEQYAIEELIKRILTDLNSIAVNYGTDIYKVAEHNLKKIPSFFKGDLAKPAKQFDETCEDYEKLPRKFEIKFIEAGEGKSIMQMNEVNIGDKLTDNSHEDDGYRFHDVFHLANVATLGWSPVLRRMLHRKRKSDPDKDEKEDGARAAIVEELVVNLIFNYVEQNSFLEHTQNVDIGVLKQIKKLVSGLEVEVAEPWEWKHCIIEGCRIFREIRNYKTGVVEVDSDKRSITFKQS